ncbi:hypothetical protein Glove_442g12 [Diversispora epigaea]|uniref:Uncharacterized protein n=2 Tax=Diversispora epigaea TaxID=1348612 RepID=A0A397GUQ9_9GLOM|nr:hypothetical protein Glove_442g12 [Diversispora epigaea]
MATVRKTRNPKTNSFTSILDQFLKKYNLSVESNPLQLRAHADELDAMLPDWKARKDVKEALRRRVYKGNQIEALVPDKRGKKLTIKERARYCAKTGDVWDIWLHASDLAVPKNNTDEAIVAAKAGVDSKQIDTYAKLSDLTRASNKIQQRKLEEGLHNPPKTPKHFSLEKGLRRIQNFDVTKIPTMQDLADVIVMLSMRPAEVTTLRIIHYEPGKINPPEWYKPGYSWYCTGYIKNKGDAKNNPEPRRLLSMEKNPERAKELLTWIQDAIATGKLRNPVYSISGKRSTGVFSKFLKPYGITAKRLRKIGGKHASRVHSGQNPTSQHLKLLSRIAMRHKIDRFDSGMYYAEGDTSDSESESDSNDSLELGPSEAQASTSQPKNNNYDPFGSQIAEIDSMLATL